MDLKDMSCPNCGANLKFNSRTHSYVCEYCKSDFKDTKNGSSDSRVELSPEDLEMMKPKNKTRTASSEYASVKNLLIITGIIIFVIIFATVSFVSITFDYMDEEMDDFENDFDDGGFGNGNFGNNNSGNNNFGNGGFGNNNFGNGGFGTTTPPYWWYD